MKTFALGLLLSAVAVQAQITAQSNGTVTCSPPGGNFCAGDSLKTNIIYRCTGGIGFPGNCNDNLAGVPPVGVKTFAPCFQTDPTAGDAQCVFNCVSYTYPNGTIGYPVGCINGTSTSSTTTSTTTSTSTSTTTSGTTITTTSTSTATSSTITSTTSSAGGNNGGSGGNGKVTLTTTIGIGGGSSSVLTVTTELPTVTGQSTVSLTTVVSLGPGSSTTIAFTGVETSSPSSTAVLFTGGAAQQASVGIGAVLMAVLALL